MPTDSARPLRRRLALVLITLTLGSGAMFTAVAVGAYLGLERTMLDDVLNRELDADAANQILPFSMSATRDARSARIRFYRPHLDQVSPPPPVAALPPGSYLDVAFDGAYYHVLVRDLGPEDRAWLLYNVEVFEARERRALLLLAIGVALSALLSWMLGGWATRHTLRPLESLVARIGALRGDIHDSLPAAPADGELAVIVTAVNGLLTQIRALVNRERAFAGAAAHELRTPITSIGIAAELLAVNRSDDAPLLRIHRAVDSARENLDALLALSSSRELPPARALPLHEWLPEQAEAYADEIQSAGTTLLWRLTPLTREVPPAALRVIFVNLLRNALRAAAGGEIVVELDAQSLAVIDNGCGIAADLLPQVFEPGTRGPGGGSGVGLYIARTLAQRCGWSLRLEPREGRGMRAVLSF